MKKFLTKIIGASLAIAMMIGVGVGVTTSKGTVPLHAVASSVSVNSVSETNSDGTVNVELSKAGGSNAPITATVNSNDGVRLYANNTMVVSSSSTITALSMTLYKNGSKTFAPLTADVGTYTGTNTSGGTATWSGSATSITFTVGTGQVQLYQIDYALSGGELTPTYTVTYNANGGTGTMADSQSPYEENSTVEVLENSFTKDGFDFVDFNTEADGSGQNYDAGDTFTISDDVTLYAQWEEREYPNAETLTITRQSVTDSSNMSYTTWTPWTQSGVSGYAKVYNNNSAFQFNNTMLFNSTSVGGKIISITMTKASGSDRSWSVYGSETPTTKESYSTAGYEQIGVAQNVTDKGTIWYFPNSSDYAYFICKLNVGSASYISSIVVRYDPYISATINGNNTVESGTQWSSTGITENESGNSVEGATYSFEAGNGVTITSSNTENGTFTATGSGVVTVSAAKRGYNIASLNVSVEMSEPYVVPEKASTSGYTGEYDVIAFEYDNLQTELSVVSNDTSVVTISELVANGTSGSVKFNFVGAGTTTVLFKDSEEVLASVSVSVTLSEVTISGLASTGSVDVGESLNLGSTITITASGSCGNSVSWYSDDDSVATVNENGVVVGVALGTANITVFANDYPSATQTCAVTVTMPRDKMVLAESIEIGDVVCLASNAVSMQYNGPSTTSTVYGLGVAFASVPNKNCYQLEVCAGNSEGTYAFKIKEGSHENEYLYLSGDSNSLSTNSTLSNNSSWTVDFDENGNATITNVTRNDRTIWWNVGSPRFATYKGKENGDEYKYVQLWKLISPKTYLNSASTIKTISGVESDGGATVSNVALRFGGRILISDWNEINSNWPITDYGVMFARESMLTARSKTSLEEVFRNNPADVAIVHKQTFTVPVANGNEYVFTARLNLEESDYDTVFYAAPYIVAGGEYYFLQEEHESVRTLANDCYNNGGSSLSQTALATLKGNN